MKADEIDVRDSQAGTDEPGVVRSSRDLIPMSTPEIAEFDRVPFGRIYAHAVRSREAIDRIFAEVDRGVGGFVVTPNVDHICIVETDPELRAAYREAFLSLPDGQPLLWMARGFKSPLPEKVSGSDLIIPLLEEAARRGRTVFFLGSSEGSCVNAVERLAHSIPTLKVVGWQCPTFEPFGENQSDLFAGFDEIRRVQPDLVLFAFGNPKQEYAMWRYQEKYFPAVGLGVGASIDFLAGAVERSPKWMSEMGLEWLFRLSQEPSRLWRRYLVRDRAILGIFWRTRRQVRSQRASQ